MLVNTFVVRPDIFIAYPINRAFVEGRAKHPPLLLRNVHPLAAGFCAGLGVHIARLWLR